MTEEMKRYAVICGTILIVWLSLMATIYHTNVDMGTSKKLHPALKCFKENTETMNGPFCVELIKSYVRERDRTNGKALE